MNLPRSEKFNLSIVTILCFTMFSILSYFPIDKFEEVLVSSLYANTLLDSNRYSLKEYPLLPYTGSSKTLTREEARLTDTQYLAYYNGVAKKQVQKYDGQGDWDSMNVSRSYLQSRASETSTQSQSLVSKTGSTGNYSTNTSGRTSRTVMAKSTTPYSAPSSSVGDTSLGMASAVQDGGNSPEEGGTYGGGSGDRRENWSYMSGEGNGTIKSKMGEKYYSDITGAKVAADGSDDLASTTSMGFSYSDRSKGRNISGKSLASGRSGITATRDAVKRSQSTRETVLGNQSRYQNSQRLSGSSFVYDKDFSRTSNDANKGTYHDTTGTQNANLAAETAAGEGAAAGAGDIASNNANNASREAVDNLYNAIIWLLAGIALILIGIAIGGWWGIGFIIAGGVAVIYALYLLFTGNKHNSKASDNADDAANGYTGAQANRDNQNFIHQQNQDRANYINATAAEENKTTGATSGIATRGYGTGQATRQKIDDYSDHYGHVYNESQKTINQSQRGYVIQSYPNSTNSRKDTNNARGATRAPLDDR